MLGWVFPAEFLQLYGDIGIEEVAVTNLFFCFLSDVGGTVVSFLADQAVLRCAGVLLFTADGASCRSA